MRRPMGAADSRVGCAAGGDAPIHASGPEQPASTGARAGLIRAFPTAADPLPGFRVMRALAIAAALAAAAACAPGAGQRVYSVEVLANYSPGTFGAFAAAGPAVEFRGALPGGATPEQTAAALSLPGWWPQTPFRAVPEGAESQRLVIAFGAAGDAGALCEPGPAPATTPGRLEAAAAYCLGRRVASLGRLSAAGDLAPGDPVFAAAMRALLTDVAPTREPRVNEDSEFCVLPPC